MWCLKGHEGFCVYILPNQKKSFGKLSDIKLEGDATISRLHATVSVEPIEGSEGQYKCVINDKSKYGTFVIRDKMKKKLSSDVTFVLKAGDIVQFGLKETTFTVLCHSFIIVKSSLNEQEMMKLTNIVHNLKITLSETWDSSCTHLTVAENTLYTRKLVCALASAKPIITNAYWEAVNVAIEKSKELPEIEDFLPKLKEKWLKVNSKMLLPNENRRTLFKGLSFVHFCEKQYFAFSPLITAAGGKSCVYPTKRPLTPRALTAKNAIVIQQPANDSTQFTQAIAADYPIIYHKLQTVKRRMISDHEITLAILHCNTKMYCNPKYDFATFFKSETEKSFSSETIVENTQDNVNTDTKQIKRKIIPETCESPNNENVSKKIRCSDENERNISNVNESNSNITVTQDADNRESKCKIIPETCESLQTNKKIYSINESERKCVSGINENNIAMNNMQNADNKEMKCEMTDKTCDSKNIVNISFEFINDSKEYVNNILFDNANKQIIPESCSIEKNMSDIFSGNDKKIIPESCSIEKNISDIFSGNNKKIIFETSNELNEELIENDFAIGKEQQNIKLEEKEILKKDNAFAINNKKENMLQGNKYEFQQQKSIINEESNIIFEKNHLHRQRNLIDEKNRSINNDTSVIAKWENSKNAKTSHIVSIEEINDNKINIKQGKEISLFEKDYPTVELHDSLEEQELNPIYNSEKNQEYKRVKKDKIQTKDNKKEEYRKTGGKRKYLNQGYTNSILRKDVPCGKKFIKVPIIKPERILKINDFVL